MYVCICMYMYLCICMYVYIHVYIHAFMQDIRCLSTSISTYTLITGNTQTLIVTRLLSSCLWGHLIRTCSLLLPQSWVRLRYVKTFAQVRCMTVPSQSWTRISRDGKSPEKQEQARSSQRTELPQPAPYTDEQRLQNCAYFRLEQSHHDLDRYRDRYHCFGRVVHKTALRQMCKMM